jgi:hypothetical protein
MTTEERYPLAARQWGIAWITVALALGVHVIDEALNDFLGYWNPLVESIRTRVPLLPLPTFSLGVWLAGLILAVALLLLMSRFAFQGRGWMRPLSYFLFVFMLGNGSLHIFGTIVTRQPVPGVYSSPILLLSGIYLFVAVRRYWRGTNLVAGAA